MASKRIGNASDLAWPECLGTFDEESCRFFLRQLGQKIVQNYPFSVGMEEVYAQIVDEYGSDGAADAIGVLHELLEDDGAGSGLGDDGDIWRSWRYSWRHRNDDPTNPYIPRARGRILGPPTTARIRLLKSANFAQYESTKSNVSAHDMRRTSMLTPPSCARQASESVNTIAPLVRVRGGNCQDISHQRSSSPDEVTKYDPSTGKSSVKRDESKAQSSLQRDSSPTTKRVGQYILVTPESLNISASKRQGSNTSPKSASFSLAASLQSPKSSHDLNISGRKSFTNIKDVEIDENLVGQPLNKSAPRLKPVQETGASTLQTVDISPVTKVRHQPHCDLVQKISPASRLLKTQENRLSLPSELSLSEVDTTPCRKRTLHRQARLIDGTLFDPSTRKSKNLESVIKTNNSVVKLSADQTTNRLSVQSTQDTAVSRISWLHNVLSRFRKHNNQTQKFHSPKRYSNLADCIMPGHGDGKTITRRHRAATGVARPAQGAIFGLDGACEVNNKPLPLSPADHSRKASQQEPRKFRFEEHFESDFVPLEDILIGFRGEQEPGPVMSATMTGPHELSPDELRWKHDSPSPPLTAHLSSSTYSNIADGNPYDDSSTTSTPQLSTPSPLSYSKQQVSSAEWPFRQQFDSSATSSQSEPQMRATLLPSERSGRASPDLRPNRSEHKERGRRPESPSTPRDQKLSLSPTKPARQRSRSPVKRLLGMVKSNSTNQIPADCHQNSPAASSRTNKKKWKEFSHKLRHGFLTADLEQLDQEEMMQQYISNNGNENSVRIITPPSNGDRSVFPVSLKSAGQNILWSELEFALIETSNTFLKRELEAGRLARDSILRTKHQWLSKNRPQVIEFYYDHATQSELILANLRSIKLYSDYCEDAVMLNSVLHQWKILVRELSVKTLCMPDSVVRRWVHDGRRVLELLGASYECLFKFDKISTLCVSVINSHQKERAKQRRVNQHAETHNVHQRSVSDGSQKSSHTHEAALMALRPFASYTDHPPMPSPTSIGPNIRKLTSHERVLVQSLKQKHSTNRPTHSHAHSASLPGIKQRG